MPFGEASLRAAKRDPRFRQILVNTSLQRLTSEAGQCVGKSHMLKILKEHSMGSREQQRRIAEPQQERPARPQRRRSPPKATKNVLSIEIYLCTSAKDVLYESCGTCDAKKNLREKPALLNPPQATPRASLPAKPQPPSL